MTTWEVLATVVTAWVLLAGTGWLLFVAQARTTALKEIAARKRLAMERGLEQQERLLGAVSEGNGPETSDAQEAAREQRAIRRMQGR
jgi:hypothetical protein